MLNLKPIPKAKADKVAPKLPSKNGERHNQNASSKAWLVRQMCMLMGIGEGATPSNQVYGDGYFANSLRHSIEAAGYTEDEIQAAAKVEADGYMRRKLSEGSV
jgi:hypothetical protein